MTNIFDEPIKRFSTAKIQMVIAIALICCGGLSQAFALPRIITQPADASVSLGAIVTNLVSASTAAPPLSYQWRFNDAEIAGGIKGTLVLTNLQLSNAGSYSVVVTDTSGSVTSRVATLDVDPTFRMITASPIATDSGPTVGAAWGDYDNDGFPDLLLGNISGPVDFLYRNKGDGTFERVLTNVIGGFGYGGGAWADYDNDGFLDLYTVSARDLGVRLYHNQGNGTLLRVTNTTVGPIVTDHSFSGNLSWGDFDNDGFVDLFVANGTFQGDLKNYLYRNKGDGTFAKVISGSIVNDLRDSWAGAWADYDDDGRLDLFVSNTQGENDQMYHNNGPGGFTSLTAAEVGPLVNDGGTSTDSSHGCAWGDYDNDGHLDLFVAGTINRLYHNNGNGTFEKVTSGAIVTNLPASESVGCSWVDYDNDGYLDLFVVNVAENNFLYHNNGDGTFQKILTGSLVNDGTMISIDCAWADYDNDGFMDVVIVADDGHTALFHNSGNSNHWINLKLVGTASNRAGIGAKVRVEATIGGKTIWQRRDIGGSGSQEGQSELRAGFGLRDATNIDTVRIEWPSGTIQELHKVGADQFLTVTEPARLKWYVIGGQYQLILNGGIGFTYDMQASTNLVDWTSLANLVTTNMTMPVLNLDVAQAQQKYFRALRQ